MPLYILSIYRNRNITHTLHMCAFHILYKDNNAVCMYVCIHTPAVWTHRHAPIAILVPDD